MAENIRDLIKDPETFFLITGEFKKISTLKKKLLNTKRFNKKILILRIKEDADQLDEITAKEWISKLEKSMEEKTFFGMCPYITYIYEV